MFYFQVYIIAQYLTLTKNVDYDLYLVLNQFTSLLCTIYQFDLFNLNNASS